MAQLITGDVTAALSDTLAALQASKQAVKDAAAARYATGAAGAVGPAHPAIPAQGRTP